MVKSTSRRTRSKKKPAASARAQGVAPQAAGQQARRVRQSAATPGKPAKASAKGKWVYSFGDGKAEGRAGMRDLLGGKGAGLAEMANLGLPVPPGFTITTEVCTQYYANGKRYPDEPARAGRRRARRGRPHHRQGIRRQRQSAAGLGALGRARLDAGHDGHRAQSRPQRRDRRGAGAEVRRPRFAYDSYRRFITMYSDVVLGVDHHHFEEILDDHKDRNGYELDTDLSADDWVELVAALQGAARGGARRAVPAGSARAALGRDRRGVRLLDEPARHHLSPPAQHPGKLGHRGQRAGHGVRQYGRDLGDRRRLHAQSLDRREAALRRVPDQCAGRGRGRRHPHAAGDHRGRARGGRLRQAVDGKGDAGGVQGADPHLRRARAALPRHAGPRIHGRAGQAVDAADPLGQAHRQGGAQDRGRARQRGADHARGGGHPHRPGRARPAAASDHRSQCRAQGDRDRAAGLARRGGGRDRVLGRRGRDAEGAGTRRSSWCGSRPRRRTSTACTRPRAFSPRAAA